MLQRTFCHLDGVGVVTERKIWAAGARTWEEFLAAASLPVFKTRLPALQAALRDDLKRLDDGGADHLAEHLSDRLPPSEAWRLFLAYPDRTAYLDIETDGTPASEVTVVGVYDGHEARAYVQGANLHELENDLARFKVLVTFNGRSFDAPVLERNLGLTLPKIHVDLRCVLTALGLTGGLKACEKRYGLDREELDGADGYTAVRLWRAYDRYNDREALETHLAYNAADILSLEVLLAHAVNAMLGETPFAADLSLPIPRLGPNPFSASPRALRRAGRRPGPARGGGDGNGNGDGGRVRRPGD